jgi:hypothetical protein
MGPLMFEMGRLCPGMSGEALGKISPELEDLFAGTNVRNLLPHGGDR